MRTIAAMMAAASGGMFGLGGFAMALSDDAWISEHSIIDPERLPALGMITAFWNYCEQNLFFIFCAVFHLQTIVGWIIAHDMGDIAVSSRIKEMLKIDSPDSQLTDLILNGLEVYDCCRINRNTLTHFTFSVNDDGTFDFARRKGPSSNKTIIPSSLNDVRRVALETKLLSLYLWHLHESIRTFGSPSPRPFPPKLELPELLLKHPPRTDTKRQRPPKSSRASHRKAKS
jgi:hypothetical protein